MHSVEVIHKFEAEEKQKTILYYHLIVCYVSAVMQPSDNKELFSVSLLLQTYTVNSTEELVL
jgi:hypothetical protein